MAKKPTVKKKITRAKVKEDIWEGEETLPISEDFGSLTYKFRYVAYCQDESNPDLYRAFAESDNLSALKLQVEKDVQDLRVGALITDRDIWLSVHKYNLPNSKSDSNERVVEWIKEDS